MELLFWIGFAGLAIGLALAMIGIAKEKKTPTLIISGLCLAIVSIVVIGIVAFFF